MVDIKKAIIPVAGLGTRFLPLSKVVPKELWPVVDKPMVQYTIEEAKASGINQIIFVITPETKAVLNYFKKSPKIEKILKEKKKDHLLTEIKNLEELCKDLSFSYVFQKKPLGDGQAVLAAKDLVGKEPCLVLYPDDIVESKVPSTLQLIKIFKTAQKPVMALYRLPKEKLPLYGVVAGEKITSRLYKIKKIIEKPSIEEAPSDLVIVGKRILTEEVFDYLKKAKPLERGGKRGEICLSSTFAEMVKDGKIVYGYEIEGKWLECGNKLGWLESNLYLSLKHPQFGDKLKKFLKELNL
ncbi:MAG: UTP--glucose-1-phosphate uridylyltransferase [Candidatus Nealsonbacteria bacterium CG23_combo_of_CG06-09_8_20_14_all_36_12]|uniref:UTP--glucose-1-phosphate uridylyltransferase n=2 Tax=Candidatus Nealsoniibacteriota TaxID=1817911 RepID=A0A2H0TLS4_9BACT|nr:MAG: UTP--glucose-1-phosphate uridylyltransferase [Candidatus Nealsonbacteria bacterium CG23_combo_of_CG06-09_8_20_14_all_36_12]PIR73112.1 MAG: UTP--glucose-1-phosphate uridylyltransferase [Candidatus Nealsonbacteria bacterium CG10_big_fil_rev_8_21_14_0_10_36_23]